VLSVRFGPRTGGAWPDLGHSRGVRGRQRTDFTHAIDLRGGFEPLWLKFGQSVRRYHGRGSRDGLNVRYSSSAADVDRFYAAYDYNTRAWPAHERKPLALFRNLATLAPGAARIWLVEDAAGATLAGAIAVEFGDSVHFWAGARDARLDRQHANLLLFPEIIRDACERGFAWFDFGSSQGLSHVQSFKEQFRPQQFDYPVWTFEGPLAGTLRRLRRAA
jgi:lipid II:glycine glycyltransferase (peptidoglycan interpeptide bridge formation enzyme)